MQRTLMVMVAVALLLLVVLLAQLWYRPQRQESIQQSLRDQAKEMGKLTQVLDRLAASQEDLAAQQAALLEALQQAQSSGQTAINVASIVTGEAGHGDGVVKPEGEFSATC